MATNLTDNTVSATYEQLLHVDGGPDASEKIVYGGGGVPTALKVGTGSVAVDNVQIDGNTIRATNTDGGLTVTANGSGAVSIPKVAISSGTVEGITDLAIADGGTGASTASGARANLGLGSIATQAADNITITGGSISGVSFSGTFTGVTAITSDAFHTSATAAGLTLSNNDLLADGTDTNIDIDLIPKGTGKVDIPKVEIDTVSAPHEYGIFYDLSNQTFAADTPTAVEFDTTGITDAISVVSNSRITFANAGTYEVTSRLQFQNTDTSDRVADIWFRLSGVDTPNSASEISVPKAADGGKTNHTATGILTVTAGQYIEVVVAVEDADTSLHYHAPFATPGDAYDRPAVPSAIIVVRRLV